MMIYRFFRETQDSHGIKSKDLAQLAGVNQKHLSQFRNGKASVTLDLLWRLVQAMDELSPGARRDFGLRLGGCCQAVELKKLIRGIPPEDLVQAMDNEQLASVISAFAESLKKSRESSARDYKEPAMVS